MYLFKIIQNILLPQKNRLFVIIYYYQYDKNNKNNKKA